MTSHNMSLRCVAIYNDGTRLSIWDPHPETGIVYSSEQIDRSKLVNIAIFNSDNLLLVQWFEPGQQLILRRRVQKSTGNNEELRVILVGWQKQINDELTKHVSVVFEDGRVENISEFKDDHPWFYAIKEVPADKQIIGR